LGAGDGGSLAAASMTVLKCLEDKEERGGFVAAPGAPWGETNHDGNHVYNLVWARDLYHATTALLDLGDAEPASRALRHLARVQRPDGSWPQNWFLSGKPHWNGTELDEVAYPILLARRLQAAEGIDWDPYPQLIRRAAVYLVRNGPQTPLDRWEDAGGLSPSTLAVAIAALVSASEFAHAAGEHLAAAHFLHVADYWADQVEAWCYSPDRGYYVRLASDPEGGPGPETVLSVDFIELVRLGVRRPDHPEVRSSIAQVDTRLLWVGPGGPAWRRYIGDTYGERPDGSPWGTGGVGRPWPLLCGERGHLALASGEPVAEYVLALEACAGPELLLPEQVWDGRDMPRKGLISGRATGSAAPLGWAHAEYLKLLVAFASSELPDRIDPARRRYAFQPPAEPAVVWSESHPVRTVPEGRIVRVQIRRPADVVWTADGGTTSRSAAAHDTGLGFRVADLPVNRLRPGTTVQWTLRYPDGTWDPEDYQLRIVPRGLRPV